VQSDRTTATVSYFQTSLSISLDGDTSPETVISIFTCTRTTKLMFRWPWISV